jgi:TonB-linked SusC/RagA family outer membrane protein
MRKQTKAFCFVWLLLLSLGALAQTVVSGTVTDAGNAPLTGVSVRLRGSATATTTDAAGRFSLTVPQASGTLEFSFVGFVTQTVAINSATTNYTVRLQEAEARLNEVVITGLASSVKRSNLANAVSSVSAKELTGITVQPTMDAALYGKFTGSNITANSGAPGGGISVKLRGITSLVANSQPLFIVDGVFFDNSSIAGGLNTISKAAGQGSNSNQDNPSNRIADLDPMDIERIEILKGASAAAIYGSRAAAGVVLITTKRGRAGKPRIEVSQSIGFQSLLRKLGQREWTEAKVRTAFGASAVPIYQAANGQVFDYEEELYGNTGAMSTSRLGVSGGNESTRYYTSVSHKNDKGIVKGTGYRKTSVRLNLDQKVTSFIDANFGAIYVSSRADRGFFNNDNTSTTLGVSFVSTPSWVNLFPDANGNYPNNPLAPSNFLQTRDLITNRENVDRILLTGNTTVRILNGERHKLRLVARGGVDQYTLNTIAIFPPELQFQKNGNGTNGASIYGTTITRGKNIAAFLVDEFDVSGSLNLRTQVGLTGEDLDQNSVLNTATQLIGSQTNLNQAGSIRAEQVVTRQRDRGFFVQEEVNFNEKIIGTLGLRGDKSSRNGNANKLYYYPKASVALNLHRILTWNSRYFNQLKLRAAYGQSGNFAPFSAIYTPLVPAIFRGTTGSVVDITRGNENLEPERQKELEMGFDAGFFNNRLSVEFTYYNKEVEDLILPVVVPLSSGFSNFWRNVAAIQNKGVEVQVNASPVVSRSVRWNITANFWKNNAKVTRLDVPAFNTGAFGATLGTYRVELGKSPTQIVGIGTAADKVDPATGLAVYGNGEPDFNLSTYNDIVYKNFELSFLTHWKKGGENINLTTLLSDIFGTSPDFDRNNLDPAGQKTNGDYRLASLGSTASAWVEDASYFRLREIGLSYRFPKTLFRNVADLQIGVSGRNLINIFKYNSYDPEVSNFGANAISSNVEVTPFPSAKSVHFNVNVTF